MNEEYQNFKSGQQEPEQPEAPQEAVPQYTAPEMPQYNQAYSAYNAYQAPAAPPQKPPKKKRWGLRIALVALCCALIGSAAGGAIVGGVMHSMYKDEIRKTQMEEPSSQPTTPSGSDQQVIQTKNPSSQLTPAEIYEKNVSAVVSISNQATTNVFGQITSTASSGTGFIISADGEILTNYHVVKGASKLTVTLNSGDTYEAKVIGYEEDSDVALIKIEAENLSTVQLGDSSSLRVGDEVAAVGNPLGELTNTMTVGYVSALDRYINTDGSPLNMMQIDAAINSGNSGGPLFDMNGNVVGITTAKYSGTTNSGTTIEGIGFAIPIDDVKSILDDLRTNGRVTNRAYIGIVARSVSSDESEKFGLPLGALVDSVEEGGSGEKAGLQRYDIITAIDGKTVETIDQLSSALKSYRAGDQATLTIYRSGQTMDIAVTFGEKPQTTQSTQEQTVQPSEETPSEQSGGWGFPWNILP